MDSTEKMPYGTQTFRAALRLGYSWILVGNVWLQSDGYSSPDAWEWRPTDWQNHRHYCFNRETESLEQWTRDGQFERCWKMGRAWHVAPVWADLGMTDEIRADPEYRRSPELTAIERGIDRFLADWGGGREIEYRRGYTFTVKGEPLLYWINSARDGGGYLLGVTVDALARVAPMDGFELPPSPEMPNWHKMKFPTPPEEVGLRLDFLERRA
jgi:hypothetical protein